MSKQCLSVGVRRPAGCAVLLAAWTARLTFAQRTHCRARAPRGHACRRLQQVRGRQPLCAAVVPLACWRATSRAGCAGAMHTVTVHSAIVGMAASASKHRSTQAHTCLLSLWYATLWCLLPLRAAPAPAPRCKCHARRRARVPAHPPRKGGGPAEHAGHPPRFCTAGLPPWSSRSGGARRHGALAAAGRVPGGRLRWLHCGFMHARMCR